MSSRLDMIGGIRKLLARGIPGVTVLLCIASTGASLGAWQLQRSAAEDLIEARVVQSRKIGSNDSPPPSPAENRAIIASLDRGIAVRKKIDDQLRAIESSVASLAIRQQEAEDITKLAYREVAAIGRALGGATGAAQRSVTRLGRLRLQLRDSAELARAIAEELEELDRKMGPGGGP